MDTDCPWHTKEIRFGTRVIRAPAIQLYSTRPVFRVDLFEVPNLNWILPWTPKLLHRALEYLIPEWFLPPTVIVKEANSFYFEGYVNEKQTYAKLKQLQRRGVVPRCFGEAKTPKYGQEHLIFPALVIEFIEGQSLFQLPFERLASDRALADFRTRATFRMCPYEELHNPKIKRALEKMFDLLTEAGVVHGDPQVHNFILHEKEGIWSISGNGRGSPEDEDEGDVTIIPIDFEHSHWLPDEVECNENQLQLLMIDIKDVLLAAAGAWGMDVVYRSTVVEGGKTYVKLTPVYPVPADPVNHDETGR